MTFVRAKARKDAAVLGTQSARCRPAPPGVRPDERNLHVHCRRAHCLGHPRRHVQQKLIISFPGCSWCHRAGSHNEWRSRGHSRFSLTRRNSDGIDNPPRWTETGRGRILATRGLRPILKLPLQNQKDSDFAGATTEFLWIRNSSNVQRRPRALRSDDRISRRSRSRLVFVAVGPGSPILTDRLNSLRCKKILASR